AQEASAIARSVAGLIQAREAFVRVVQVDSAPGFVEPGGSVRVSARVLNVVNRPQEARASYTVRDAAGTVLFASSPVPVSLGVQAAITTIDLGVLGTAGFARGNVSIEVTLSDPATGRQIPGASARGTLLIGSPVTAGVAVTPTVVAAGDG